SLGRDLSQAFGEEGPVGVGKAHVEQRDLESRPGGRERLRSGGGGAHLVAFVAQDLGQIVDERGIVVDEQDPRPMGHRVASYSPSMASSSSLVWKGFSKTRTDSAACSCVSGKAVMARM